MNWYRYSVNVETKDVSDHLSFTIYKYGSVYRSKSLSGDGNMSLCSEVLDDGEYTIEYKCRYRKDIFHSYTTYTFTYSFEVDKDELGNTVEVSFIIDKTAATLVLNGVENTGKTKGEVSLTDLFEKATVVVTKGGETIEYTLGELLNEAGRYAITVTDTCGNVSEYSFEITKGISGWADCWYCCRRSYLDCRCGVHYP